MNISPKISVVIPVYNPGKHLYKCLDSIINQTYKNLEIILVDDGSTDGSDKVCDDYQKKDERVKVKHIENSGVSRARNMGIDMATGDYINFPDSDDYIDLDTYEVLMNTIEKEGVDAACFEYYITFDKEEIKHTASDGKYGIFDAEGSIHELLFSNRSFLCTKLLPMTAVKDLRFLENIYRDEDTIFCMMALHNTKKTVFIDRPMYHYVQSEESACRGEFRPNQLSMIDAIPIVEEFLGKNYPAMITPWRQTYMHLLITLYVDMYSDQKEYKEEKARAYNTFKKIKNQVKTKDIGGFNEKVKFELFSISPEIFCRIHNRRFK